MANFVFSRICELATLAAMENKCLYELEDLAESVGEFIQYWGFKKIHGKVWCLLFLSKTPLDAQCLIQHLKISKALVSQTLSELKDYNVIIEVGKSEKKTVCYTANPHITEVIFGVLRTREKRLLCKIFSSYRLLESLEKSELDKSNIDLDKVKRMGTMINFAEKFLQGVLSFQKLDFGQWRNIFR